MALKEDYLDDILDTSANEKRKYRMINNADGTISLEDVTEYSQNGDNFGAYDINITNKTVNELIAMGLNVRCNSDGYLEVLVDGVWKETDILAYSQTEYIIEKGVITGKFGGLETHSYKPETVLSPNVYPPTLTQKNDYIEIKSVNTDSANGGGGIVSTKEIIDMAKYSKLTMDVSNFNRVGSSAVARILLSNELKNGFVPVTNTLIDKNGTYTVDLSSVNSECYIFIYMWCDINETLTLNVSNIWLE